MHFTWHDDVRIWSARSMAISLSGPTTFMIRMASLVRDRLKQSTSRAGVACDGS
jgi:hypothetical protein